MADYKTRLTADTSQHDQALKKSAQQVYQYKQKAEETDKSIGKLAGKFSKFVGVLSVAKIASEGFNSVMRNNQTAADNYGATMEVAKRISNEFFYSISKADFSTMINGLGSCISAAREYYNALDNLQTLQLGLIGENARLDKEMQKARTRVRKGDETAVKDIERISKQMLNNVQKEQASINNTLSKMIKSTAIGSGSSGDYNYTFDRGFNVEQVQRWVSGVENLDIAITQAKNKWMDLKDKASEYNDMNGIHSQVAMAEAEYKALEALKDKMSDGDNLKEFEQMYAKMQNLEAQYEQMEQRNLRYTKELGADKQTNNNKPVTVKVKAEFEAGSIAEVEKQIRDLQNRLQNENLNGSERRAITEQIEVLQLKKQTIEDMGKPLEHLKNAIEEMPTLDGSIIDGEAIHAQLQQVIDDIDEVGTTIEDLENLESLGDSLGYIGDCFSNLSGIMGDEAGKIFSALGNSIGAIGTAIAKISSLMMAEGAASVMDLPYPANLAALATVIATVTSVIASIASIGSQKFADGGIFNGKTTIGDYNLARVNAGEMILNNRQQQHLFNLLNSGTQAHDNSTGGNVTFTIHGSDLQGTLSNYNKRVNRVK